MTRVRYLGVIPRTGCREYGFHVEDEDKSLRLIVLTIDDVLFLGKKLKFQEAPDLCYQKMKYDLDSEDEKGVINSPVTVTLTDIAKYRDSHPEHRGRAKR